MTAGRWLPRDDLVEWLALRRVARGLVAFSRGGFFDGGQPVAADVAGAVPALIDAGYVALAPVDAWGMRRASLTIPRGCERFAELTGARAVEADADPRSTAPGPAAGRVGPPWAVSTFDDRCHAVAVRSPRQVGRYVALCGLVLASSVALHRSPGGSRVCGTCAALALVEVGR